MKKLNKPLNKPLKLDQGELGPVEVIPNELIHVLWNMKPDHVSFLSYMYLAKVYGYTNIISIALDFGVKHVPQSVIVV